MKRMLSGWLDRGLKFWLREPKFRVILFLFLGSLALLVLSPFDWPTGGEAKAGVSGITWAIVLWSFYYAVPSLYRKFIGWLFMDFPRLTILDKMVAAVGAFGMVYVAILLVLIPLLIVLHLVGFDPPIGAGVQLGLLFVISWWALGLVIVIFASRCIITIVWVLWKRFYTSRTGRGFNPYSPIWRK